MALNPFEQLQLFVSEPRQAFEDLAMMLLLDCGLIDGRVAIFCGDGGIDAYQSNFDKEGELTVYQSKHFTKPWVDVQQRQIRESFETAAKANYNLRKWFLCIPVRPTRQDIRWFDGWKARQSSSEIDLLDGDDLTKMLEGPEGARTRQRFRDWGVFTVRSGSPVLQARVRCIKNDPRAFQTFRLFVQLENRGDRTAEDIRIKLGHSSTQCVPAPHNSVYWDDFGSGILNPRALRTKSDLHPGETLEVLQIPLVASTPFPISISIEYWLRDQQSGRQSLILREPPVENDLTFDLAPGELALNAGADGGFAQSALKWPEDLFVEGLLINIAQHLRPEEFGVVDFGVDAAKLTQASYRPHLAQSGPFWSMDRASLTIALDNLVNSGWLDPADNMGKAIRYRLSDAARIHGTFMYQVERFEKQRLENA